MKVTVRTPTGDLYTDLEVQSITVRSTTGVMQILPHHASFQGVFTFSPVRLHSQEEERRLVLHQGFILISQEMDHVLLLAQKAEPLEALDFQTAHDYLASIREALEKRESLSGYHLQFLEDERLATEERIAYIKRHQTQEPST